ncbi:MAG: TetR/AcrR family transcriptional regulator [Ignavibacteriaceae bacterium]|nr:TetR/AcrR family transcriptional regulator [Ignavibacteriaceae bacterium]
MNNKENILKCALELFASKGYDAVGVQEIVTNAGITKPTMYYYFENKRGLLEAIMKEYASDLLIKVTKASAYHGDITKTLTDITMEYFNYAAKHPDFFRLQLSLWLAPPESEAFQVIFPYLELEQKAIEELFLYAAKDHGNMKGRHVLYALSFLGIIHTYIGISFNGYTKLNDELVYKLIHQFMHGIFS